MPPSQTLVVLSTDWYWEQDPTWRYTKLVVPPGCQLHADLTACARVPRWDLPEATALSSSWQAHRAQLARREPFQDFQYRYRAVSGAHRHVCVSGQPVFGAGGAFQGYRGTARDISELWAQREELQDARTQLELAATLGGIGAWSCDLRTGHALWGEAGGHQRIVEKYAAEYRDAVLAAFLRCANEGAPFDMEVEALGTGGVRRWVRLIGVAVRDASGRIVRVQGAFQDIHRSKEASEQQRRVAERLRTTLDSLADGFATLDRSWCVTYANPAAFTMLRLKEGEVIGRCLWDMFPEVQDTVFAENYRCAMHLGQRRRFEAYFPPLDMWLRVSAFPSQQGIALSFTDITAAMQAKQQLLRMNEVLEERVRERTAQLARINEELVAFTMAASHDLRAPLAAISGFASALADRLQGQHADAKSAHYLDRIRAGARRMDDLLQGLVELSRVGRAELHPVEVDLTAMARETLEGLRAGAPERHVHACVAEGLRVRGDAGLLRTVLENLIGNAWKFSAQRSPARIEVGCTPEGVFHVRDNGAGFEPDAARELFTPFRRLHDAATFRGIGVGLASARRVVERHAGRIWAEAAPDRGATFFFTLGTPATAPRRTSNSDENLLSPSFRP